MNRVNVAKLCCLIASLFSSSFAAAADPDPNFWVFLAFGQSNMVGQGQIEEQDQNVDERFRVLADFDNAARGWKRGEWYTANPPLTSDTTGVSLVDGFGRAMVAALPVDHRVGVVKMGVNGTRIEMFDEDSYQRFLAGADAYQNRAAERYDNNPYRYLVAQAKTAQQSGVIRGVLLHQGESNARDPDWANKVKKIYDSLMRDLELDPAEAPLVAGEAVNADQRGVLAGVNEMIATLPEIVPTAHVVSSAGVPARPDRLHFTAEGYRRFGRRYAQAMLQALGLGEEAAALAEGPAAGPD